MNEKPKLRFLRFGVRTLLVVITVAAVTVAVCTHRVETGPRQAVIHAIAELRSSEHFVGRETLWDNDFRIACGRTAQVWMFWHFVESLDDLRYIHASKTALPTIDELKKSGDDWESRPEKTNFQVISWALLRGPTSI